MIIDTHTHIGRNDLLTASVDDLLRSMDKAGIDKSFVFAAPMFGADNEWMLDQIKPHKDRLFGVATLPNTLISPNLIDQVVRWYAEEEIVACKFYVGYEHRYPIQCWGLWRLEQIGCPVIFHSGDCFCKINHAKLKYAHPLHIDEVAVDFPNLNIIIAHMGFPWVRDAAEVCYKNENCYADVSGFVYGKFDSCPKFKRAIDDFLDITEDVSKLVFGSDWPISDQTSYVQTVKNLPCQPFQDMLDTTLDVFKLRSRLA